MTQLISSAILQIQADISGFQANMSKAARSAQQSMRVIQGAAQGVTSALNILNTVGISIGGAQIVRMADEYNTLQRRIQSTTKATGDYKAVSQELFKLTQQTGATLRSTVDVFSRVSLAAKNLGASNKDILQLTKTVQQLGVIGGSLPSQMQAGLLQLSQGLSSGVLHAEELNSVIENLPLVANKIAEGMGMTTAELRNATIKGKILSSEVFASLMKQSGEINKEFSGMNRSFEQSFSALRESASRAFGEIAKSTGFIENTTKGMDMLAEHSQDVINAITGIGAGVATFQLLTLNVGKTTAAIKGLAGSLLGTRFGIAGLAISGLITLMVAFKDKQIEIGNQQVTLQNLMIASWQKISPPMEAGMKGVGKVFDDFLIKPYAKWFKQTGDGINFLMNSFAMMSAAIKQSGQDINEFIIKPSGFYAHPNKKPQEDFGPPSPSILDLAAARQKAEELKKISDAKPAGGGMGVDEKKLKELEKARKKAAKALEDEAKRQREIYAEFIRDQESLIKSKELELLVGKENLTVQEMVNKLKDSLNRSIYPAELEALQKLAKLKDEVAAREVSKEHLEALQQESVLLGLKAKHLEYLIPGEELLNSIRKQGIKLTEDQANALKQQSASNEIDKLRQQTEDYKNQLREQLDLKIAELEKGKEEAAILDAINKEKKKNILLSQQDKDLIRARLESINAVEKELEARKSLDKYMKSLDEEIDKLNVKNAVNKDGARIQEALNEAKRNANRDLTENEAKEIKDRIGKVNVAKQLEEAQKQLTKDQERAKDLIKESLTEQQKYNESVKELDRLYGQGLLSLEQYNQAVRKIDPHFKSVKDAAKTFSSAMSNAFDAVVFRGEKLNKTIKDMTKSLASFAAKKLLFEPMEKGIVALAEKFFGGKKPNPVPMGPSPNGNPSNGPVVGFNPQNKQPLIANAPGVTSDGVSINANDVYINGRKVDRLPILNAPLEPSKIPTLSTSKSPLTLLSPLTNTLNKFFPGVTGPLQKISKLLPGVGLLKSGSEIFRGLTGKNQAVNQLWSEHKSNYPWIPTLLEAIQQNTGLDKVPGLRALPSLLSNINLPFMGKAKTSTGIYQNFGGPSYSGGILSSPGMSPINVSTSQGSGSIFSDMAAGLKKVFSVDFMGGLGDFFKKVFSGSLLGDLAGTFKKVFSSNFLGGLTDFFKNMFSGSLFGNLANTVKSVFSSNFLGGIGDFFSGITSNIGGLFNGLIGKGLGGAIGIGKSLFGMLPGFADGGRPTGLSIVGENGPELFWPDSAGTIFNQSQIEDLLRSSMATASRGRDLDLTTSNFTGQPFYQLTGGTSPAQLPLDLQKDLEQFRAHREMLLSGDPSARAAYYGQWGGDPNPVKLMQYANSPPSDLMGNVKRWGEESMAAMRDARLRVNPNDIIGNAMLSNKHVNNMFLNQTDGSNYLFPQGNQKGRITRQHGYYDPQLNAWADQADMISDILNPSKQWGQYSHHAYNSSGMTWGAGGSSVVQTGDGDYETRLAAGLAEGPHVPYTMNPRNNNDPNNFRVPGTGNQKSPQRDNPLNGKPGAVPSRSDLPSGWSSLGSGDRRARSNPGGVVLGDGTINGYKRANQGGGGYQGQTGWDRNGKPIMGGSYVGLGPKGYAAGGRPAKNTPAWVGERGPELFVPDAAGKIIPNNVLRGGSSGAPKVTVNSYTSKRVGAITRVSPDGRNIEIFVDEMLAHLAQSAGRFQHSMKPQMAASR